MFVKSVHGRFVPGFQYVHNKFASTYNFITKPFAVRKTAISPPTTLQKPAAVQFPQVNAHTKPVVNQKLQFPFVNHNVLAKQTIIPNDRLSMQRVRMQPFQRSTNANAHYTNLGLKADATLKDIKSAYYYLAKMYHPDAKSSKDSVARQKFLQISEAYEVLSDDKRRLEYDKKQADLIRLGVRGVSAEREDTFNKKPVVTQNANAPLILEVPFLDAIRGVEREITVETSQPCHACKTFAKSPTLSNPIPCSFCNGSGYESKQSNGPNKINVRCKMCRGTRFTYKHICVECKDRGSIQISNTVKVRVLPATNDNDKVQVVHPKTGKPLEVTIKILENDQFRRRGNDVFSNVYVPYSTAVLGGTQTISSLFGGEIQVQIPPGTESDTTIRLAGKGIGKKGATSHGDHVLVVKIKVPKNVTEKQKSLLSAFATLENHPVLQSQSNQQPRRTQQEAFLMAKKSGMKSKTLFISPQRLNY